MEVQIRRRVIDQVTIVLWVMPSVIAPLALPERAMQILHGSNASAFSQYGRVRPHELFSKCRGLSHETVNHTLVRLRQHRWNHIPFG